MTRDEIVHKALELLDNEGFDGLTMRRLAERLGIKAASLYNHVRDKDELLTLMGDAICAEIPDLDMTQPWREQAEGMAHTIRRVLKGHRDGARVLAATPPIGPNRLRLVEQLLAAVTAAGFPRASVADVSFVMSSFVIGFVLDETLGEPADARARKRRQDEARRWFKSLPTKQYPTLVAFADELVSSSADRRFELGIRALLDGFTPIAQGRASSRTRR